jgi:hypothetical protein
MIFLLGVQKSGTTWVRSIMQQVLPIHPGAEWWFPKFFDDMRAHVNGYCFASEAERHRIAFEASGPAWTAMVTTALPGCKADKSAYPVFSGTGARPDLFPYAIDLVRRCLSGTTCVQIVRDPRDILVSSKYYFFDGNLSSLGDKGIVEFAQNWARYNLHWLRSKPDYVLRYEDLHRQFARSLEALMGRLGVNLDEATAERVIARFSTITESQKNAPQFYRKGIVGDWKAELTPRESALVWDIARGAMQSFGYTEDGVETRHVSVTGRHNSHDVPLDRIQGYRWNTDAGNVWRDPDALRVLVFADGLSVMIDPADVPPHRDGHELVLVLTVAWSDATHTQGKHFQVAPAFADRSDGEWHVVMQNAYTTGAVCEVAIPIKLSSIEPNGICLLLFNGVAQPFTAFIHSLEFRIERQGSSAAEQYSDTLVTGITSEDNGTLAFFRSVGWSALHFAANWGLTEDVKRLLESGVDVDIAEDNGATALFRATDFDFVEVIELLLSHGAAVDAIDHNLRETPLDVAERKGHVAAAKILRSHGGCRFGEL